MTLFENIQFLILLAAVVFASVVAGRILERLDKALSLLAIYRERTENDMGRLERRVDETNANVERLTVIMGGKGRQS